MWAGAIDLVRLRALRAARGADRAAGSESLVGATRRHSTVVSRLSARDGAALVAESRQHVQVHVVRARDHRHGSCRWCPASR